MPPRIDIYPTSDALANAAAELFVAESARAISGSGRFTVALSGGSTPKAMYEALAAPAYASRVDWNHVQLFWGDERCVPPDHVDSNYRMAAETLLDHVRIPGVNIHRMEGGMEPGAAAIAYERELAGVFGDAMPRFDLVLLGLGTNGHIASLFPHMPVLFEEVRRVEGYYVDEVDMWRLTLTPPVINAGALVLFLVSGEAKASMVARVLEGARDPSEIPAQLVDPVNGAVRWMVDEAAASALRDSR
jgi:6-phosphogluconolactonase